MRPRKYDPAMIEALALDGALDPELDDAGRKQGDRHGRRTGSAPATWKRSWSGEVAAEGGYLLRRLWRGVTDAHIVEPSFLGLRRGAQAPRARRRAGRRPMPSRRRCKTLKKAAAHRSPEVPKPSRRRRVPTSTEDQGPRARSSDHPAVANCSTRCSRPAARASVDPALQGPWRNERRAAVGNHARPVQPLAAAGRGRRRPTSPTRSSPG